MQDAISHRAASGYSRAYLTDEKRSELRHNLPTTIPITPIHGGDTNRGSFGGLLLVMNTALPASGDHLGRTIGDLTHGQRFRLPQYDTSPNFDHWNSQLTKFLRHIDHTKGYYCFVDVHFSSRNLHSLNNASVGKIKNYRDAWKRFLDSDDPGDRELKLLYESVAKHHPDQAVLSGAPEVIPFGVSFAGKLTDSALGFLYRLASIKYPKQQKTGVIKLFVRVG